MKITFDEIAAAMRRAVEGRISLDKFKVASVKTENSGEIETRYEIEKVMTTIREDIIRDDAILIFGLLSTTFEKLRESERQSNRAKKPPEEFQEIVDEWMKLQAAGIPEHKRAGMITDASRERRSTVDKRISRLKLRTKTRKNKNLH